MTCREVVPFYPHRLCSKRGGRQIAAPTGVVPLRLLFLQCGTWYRASSTAYGGPPSPKGKVLRDTIQPHGLYSERSRNGTQAVPYGFAGRWILSTTQVVFGTWLGDESSPLHCVIPFNQPGCIRNVAGGKIAAPTSNLFRFTACFMCLSLYCVLKMLKTWYIAAPTVVPSC